MSNGRACVFPTLAALIALAFPAGAQSVISTHSGVINYFEGAVYLGDQALESHLGRFFAVPPDATLRTEEGLAEVLLTPGVFLRMGGRSAIRMVGNALADTQVELQKGSVIVDSGEPNSGTSVTLIYKDWRVRFLRKGVYRIDSDPPRLWVGHGEAEVSAGSTGTPVSVAAGMTLPFAGVLAPDPSSGELADALSDWSNGRTQSIDADNAITAQIDEDPASGTAGSDGFTYFPFLGVSSLGLGAYSPYSSFGPYQSGFNSVYLPGYTYPPFILGLVGRGLRTNWPSSPRLIVVPRGAGTPVPVPRAPIVRPAPVHAAPHFGGHGVGHR